MATDEPPDDDEDLIAYLDGELDADAAGEVESRIAADSETRTKAESLRKTYDLLEYLPKSEPSPEFASKTLTKLDAVAAPLSAVNPPATLPSSSAATPILPPARHGFSIAMWALAACVAAGLGTLGHRVLPLRWMDRTPQPPAAKAPPATMQQVRLFQNLPLYAGADDLAFLKALDASEFFTESGPESPSGATVAAEAVSSTDLATLESAFGKLPAAWQEQLRKLDEDLYALAPTEQARLLATLERYAVWLQMLPEGHRREVLKAPAGAERMEAIGRVRNRIWRDGLPASVKEKVKNAADIEERDAIYAECRHQEAERRHEWDTARKQWSEWKSDRKPFPFDSPAMLRQVEEYYQAVLKPRVNPLEVLRVDDLRRDAATGGGMYLYGAVLYYLSEKYPSLPEPKAGKLVTRSEDLPEEFKRKFQKSSTGVRPMKKEFKELPQHGKWPEFAELVALEAMQRGIPLPFALGPSRPGEFKPEVEEVLTTLRSKLTAGERKALDDAQGLWPKYPKLFLDYSRKYDLVVPGAMLPGPPSQWHKIYPKPRKP